MRFVGMVGSRGLWGFSKGEFGVSGLGFWLVGRQCILSHSPLPTLGLLATRCYTLANVNARRVQDEVRELRQR